MKKKDNKEKKVNDKNNNKQNSKKTNKFIEIIKKRWIVNSSKTLVLVLIILAFFVGITVLMKNLEISPIDLTKDKIFTLTEESKEQVKNIDKDINIYFIGYDENSTALDLAKQYKKVNDKIKVEAVTAEKRPDLVKKYQIDANSQGIIVECGEKYKVLTANDLTTYDQTTYESIDITEEKLTATIKSVTADKVPKVYFLSGYSQMSLENGLSYLNIYLQNEVNDVESLNIVSKGKVPEDCNTLVINTPEKDFDEITTNAILKYIDKGGNILWLNAAIVQKTDLKNVNKILAKYGVNPFEVGILRETNTEKMVSGSQDLIFPEIQSSDATSKLANSNGSVILANATKINVANDKELEKQKVTKTDLLLTSTGAYFRTNFENMSNSPTKDEKKEAYLVGAQFDKTIKEKNEEKNVKEVKSQLIIYGENYFVTDMPLSQASATPLVAYMQNKDLVLNSIAYLSDREEDITVRKSTDNVTYTATEQEHTIIMVIIIAVPLAIIVAGIVVWLVRRRKR